MSTTSGSVFHPKVGHIYNYVPVVATNEFAQRQIVVYPCISPSLIEKWADQITTTRL